MATEKLEKMALSPEECAEVCGLHVNTVRKLIQDGKLPAIRPGGRKILISKRELERWLAGNPPSAPTGST